MRDSTLSYFKTETQEGTLVLVIIESPQISKEYVNF